MNEKDVLGKFVNVGGSIGVIVGIPDDENIPEDHYAIWYGQISETVLGKPRVRTVPIEYCEFINEIEYYH